MEKMSAEPSKIHSLLDLDDNCLHEIFCLLSIEDLTRMACSCTRMQSVARGVYHLKHKSQCVDLYEFATNNPYAWDTSINLIDDQFHNGRLLRHFGHMISDLSFTFTTEQTESFNFVFKYCSGGALERLTVAGRTENFRIDKAIDSTELFGTIKELKLYGCNHKAFDGKHLSKCQRLERLTLYKTEAGKFLLKHFPNIKSFAMQRVCDEDRRKTVQRIISFLKRHKQLTELELNSPDYCSLVLVGTLQHLERLSINDGLFSFGDEHIMPLAALTKLKSLKLYCGDKQMGRFLNSLKSTESLEELDLIFCYFRNENALMSAIGKFQQLEVFKFNGGCWLQDNHLSNLNLSRLRKLSMLNFSKVTDDGLINVVDRMPAMEELTLNENSYKFRLSSNVYNRVADICENRESKLVMMVNCGIDVELEASLYYQRGDFFRYYDSLDEGTEYADYEIDDDNEDNEDHILYF